MGAVSNFFVPGNLAGLRKALLALGVERAFVKKLTPNDNSKNQIYVGKDLSAIPPLPRGAVELHQGSSQKRKAGPPIFRVPLKFSWLDASGNRIAAPQTKLIYYPQFPEVRLSGFLQGSAAAPSKWMDGKDRHAGRTLVMGVDRDGGIVGVLLLPDSPVTRELDAQRLPDFNSLFQELTIRQHLEGSSRELLLSKLAGINQKGWIEAKRLDKSGAVIAYASRNSGGYRNFL